MTRIDFYLLSSADEEARLRIVCRLADKIVGLGKRLYVHTENEAQKQRLDTLLWTFRDISFLPHAIAEADGAGDVPLVLGHAHTPAPDFEVLINLAPEAPPFFSRFERLAEVVDAQDTVRQAARARYRFYRERGYVLQHHRLDGRAAAHGSEA